MAWVVVASDGDVVQVVLGTLLVELKVVLAAS